jgi:hypothetical protein
VIDESPTMKLIGFHAPGLVPHLHQIDGKFRG